MVPPWPRKPAMRVAGRLINPRTGPTGRLAGICDVLKDMPQRNGIKMICGKTDGFETADLNRNFESLPCVRGRLFRQFSALNFPAAPAKFLKQHAPSAADIEHTPGPAVCHGF